MENIIKFLKERPLISIRGLEIECSIPQGTIRLSSDRGIPDKYKNILESKLRVYGLHHEQLIDAIRKDISSIINLIDYNK